MASLLEVPLVDISTVDFSTFGDDAEFIAGAAVFLSLVVDSGVDVVGPVFCALLEILARRRQKMGP